MALIQRFSAIDKAILVATGNSLVVCGSSSEPAINTSDIIKIDGATTRDYTESGSSATLNILGNSTILYAELVWYSTVFSNVSGAPDLRSIQDNQITFNTPLGSHQITPQYTESYTAISGTIDRYRATDVTNYVKNALSGTYTVSNVPISVPSTGLSNSRAGWTLVVIYRNNIFKPQKVLYDSGIAVATPNTPLQSTTSGFTTPSDITGLRGHLFMSCANGGPLNGTEIVTIGPSFAQLTNVGNIVNSPNPNPGTAPNNPGNSFFSGVINTANLLSSNNGLLNINGTNGINNHDGFIPTQLLGARNKWDITDVDISNTLVSNQTLLAGQIVEGEYGDGIQLVALGAQVSAKAPDIIANLQAYDIDGDSEYNIEVGEVLVYSVQIKNDGDVDANNVIISANLDSSTSFIAGSVIINGVANQAANISSGINLGTISAKGIVNVFFTVKVNSIPTDGFIHQFVNYNYQFISGISTITNSATTNTMDVIVEDGHLSIIKSASKSTVNLNESITYTINIENIGTELAKDLLFQDNIDPSCSFLIGSVYIDGVNHIDYNPSTGFPLPDLLVGSSTQIVFDVVVNSLPASTKVNNVALITYGYVFNQYGYMREKTAISNSTSIQVQYVDIVGQRCNNNNYPNVGDTVTYTLSLTNIGNSNATDVQVLENPIPGTTFVTGSVKINGVTQPSLNPFTGFTLQNPIGASQTTTVSYQVLVNSIDPSMLIENIAQVPFKYTITEGGDIISSERDSNIVDTVANYVCMNIVKSVDKSYATIGDILYYKINITNSGNISAVNTVLSDIIQSQASFVSGSVNINGIAYPTYNPNVGFTLDTICPGDSIEIAFKVNINAVPTPNIIENQSDLTYSYKPDPNGVTLTSTMLSNTVQTTINKADYTIVKNVDKMYAQVGDPLVYTTTIENTGTVVLSDIKFADFLGIYLDFYPGTVYINGVSYPNLDPTSQFPINDMHPGDTTTVTFAATILLNPPVGYIPNTSEVTLSYKLSPTSPTITNTAYSNMVKTYVPYANINLSKSVDKSYAVIGDTLTYTIIATNTGNTAAINTMLTDIIQSQASFVTGSVKVNGISKPEYNPQSGFTLGRMEEGQVITIEFKVSVISLPVPNNIKNNANIAYSYYVDPNQQPVTTTKSSNIVTTTINNYSATLTKSVDKAYAVVGNTLDYTIIANNTGTVTLTDVNFIDIVSNGAAFVEGSVIVDGVSISNANPNTGFTINNILPGGNVVVMFKATVTSIPNPPQINNSATINFRYQLTPSSPYIDRSLTSNIVTTNVTNMSVTNVKSVNKMYTTLNDTLTYTSVITNNGNVNIDNTNFIDTVPNNTSFISGSVKIDGQIYSDYNPSLGFTLGTIAVGESKTITFDVIVDSIPNDGKILNSSVINYQYKTDPNGIYIQASATSNTVTSYVNLGNASITKTANRTIVKLDNIITYNFVVSNTGNVLLTNISFIDAIQLESTFNTGSVYIDGVNKPTLNPNNGFSLDNIPVGKQTSISFSVTSNTVPTDNMLLNSANTTYSYYIDPNGSPTTNTKTSNTTTVYVYDTILSTNKAVDKSIAKIGDTLSFTIDITNDSIVTAQNIQFKDILDANLTFIEDSVYIDGIQQLGYNPSTGFNLADILGGDTKTVVFSATIATRPTNNIIYNNARVDYNYTIDQEVITAYMVTNTTQTTVATGELTITKYVDKYYATVADNIYYTIVVKNTGSVDSTNLSLQDLMPASTSFNSGTVVIDGVAYPTYNPVVGFSLGDLAINEYHTVTFNIHVDTLPASGSVINTADVTFTYKPSPTDTPITTTSTSNQVTTLIKLGNLTSSKVVNKAYATIGNILSYTVTINNNGNEDCFDVFFKDLIQSNASFVTGSVLVNGVSHTDYNPITGFYIPNINSNTSATVAFNVTVQSLPTDYTIYNYASQDYKYYVNPANQPIVKESTTNTVATVINVGSLTVNKSVSKAYATIDETLTYTINILNSGNTIAKNINFRDVIPGGLTFVAGSVNINGISYPAYDPYTSFTLGNIISGDTVVVTFDAKVTSVPNPSLVSNISNITFSYRIDPNGLDITAQADSNPANTQINKGSVSLAKSVDIAYATKGDIITYTVVVTNNGNVRADNVLFTDSLQVDVVFNTGSVKINNTEHVDYNPNIGFSLGNIEPLDFVTVEFKVTVIQSPAQSSVLNYALSTFNYKIDPNGQYYSKSSQSNTVSTILILPALSSTKTVNKVYATVQDTLNYAVLVKNEGNTTISQLQFADYLSNGATFKTGTVVIDGVSYSDYNPIQGFSLPSDLVAGNTSLVQFQVTVTTLPSPPQVTNYATSSGLYRINPQGPTYNIDATSNTVTTNINIGRLSNVKTVSKQYAKVNDTVTYTSTITNTGNVNATNLFFTDILQSDLSYITGTVELDGVVYPGLDPTVGFALSNLAPGQSIVVSFSAKINSLPTPPYITNTSNVQFSYKVDPTGVVITTDQNSNTTTTNVVLGKLNSLKTVDKSIATLGDEITYNITLTNTGNTIDSNVFFQDTPSVGVSFKTGSVKVNNVSQPTYNPTAGFNLGDIGIGNVVNVLFVVTVTTVPQTNQVTNQSVTTFEFVVDPQQAPYTDTSYSNTVVTNISYGNLNVTKSVNKQYATIGEELTYTVVITNVGNIDATNIVFLDPTPQNSVFVLGSVTVNGVPYPEYNPAAGFDLNSMVPGQSITVVYKVQVINLCQ